MKREAGEDRDFDAQMKKAKVGDTEIRLLIPSKSAGSVIGKGGQNISRLRNEVSITAGEEDALNVLHEAIPLLDEVVQTMKSPSTQGTEVRMLVHQSQAGSIIGKGGSRIKELRDETGANIRIYGISCPQSTDRVVQITGEPEVILN
ncbi:unnamed protein product [Darwinula stevensoni]|uniref:K Homology domain-containing protein n=1 Tax=Darwinula stevensoni TaxID=69355 RepID=A0A7R9AD66_9CRUS|nr:unnamed protein product [Darwinula stevensoni]CAG0901016.1 unnamed protein product [Darwinula stevensoni]